MAAFNINIKKISQPQIGGGGGGGHCMSLACKYFVAIVQEFDGVNCYGSYYVDKTQVLEAEEPELYRRFVI